jgi:hypothetical protein
MDSLDRARERCEALAQRTNAMAMQTRNDARKDKDVEPRVAALEPRLKPFRGDGPPLATRAEATAVHGCGEEGR